MDRILLEERWYRRWWLGVVLLFVLTYLAVPIIDPDFFWHLHTGEWIWKHRQLPITDPFSTLHGAVDVRQRFILTSYWLAQVFYYGVYALWGWSGFFVLRLVFFYVFCRTLMGRLQHKSLMDAVLVTCFLIVFFAQYPVERPQIFSFLAFALLLLLLERLPAAPDLHAGRHVVWALPLLMLVWSNVHGGVLLGQVMCVAFLADYAVRRMHKKLSTRRYLACSVVLLAGLGATLVNPNGFFLVDILREQLHPTNPLFFATIVEYQSLLEMFTDYGAWKFLFYILALLLAAYGLFRKMRDQGIVEHLLPAALLVAFAFFSFKQVRYLGFFGILSLPMMSYGLKSLNRRVAVVGLLVVFVGCLITTSIHFGNLGRLYRSGPVSAIYPQGAVEFIKNRALPGKVFNEYGQGGYLSWALGDGYTVFVDGRTLESEKYMFWGLIYSELEKARQSVDRKRAAFTAVERVLARVDSLYGIDYIVLPRNDEESILLLTFVDRSRSWKKVFEDKVSMVFVKN